MNLFTGRLRNLLAKTAVFCQSRAEQLFFYSFAVFLLFLPLFASDKLFYPSLLIIIAEVVLLILFFFPFKLIAIQRFFLYLTIIGGFLGSGFLSYRLGFFEIFPYRIFLIVLWLITIIGFLFAPKIRIMSILVKEYLLFFGGWFVYALASLIWSDSLTVALRQIIFLFLGMSVILFSVLFFNKATHFKRFFYVWTFLLFFLIAIGALEHFTGYHLPESGFDLAKHAGERFVPFGVYNNTNDFATYLALSLPFLFSTIRHAKGGMRNFFWRPLCVFFLVLGLYVLLFTSSRFNWAAVFLEAFFIFLFMTKTDKKIKAVSISIVAVIAVVLLFPGAIAEVYDIFSSGVRSGFDAYALTHGSTIIRYNLLLNGFSLAYDHIWLGVGAGNAQYHMLKFGENQTFGIVDPHNWWLEIFINYGIIIFFGFFIFYISLIKELYKAWKNSRQTEIKMINEALTISLVGFLFASCSSSSLIANNAVWFLFAFSLSFLNFNRRLDG